MNTSVAIYGWADLVRLVRQRELLWSQRRDRDADNKTYESVTSDAMETLLIAQDESSEG